MIKNVNPEVFKERHLIRDERSMLHDPDDNTIVVDGVAYPRDYNSLDVSDLVD